MAEASSHKYTIRIMLPEEIPAVLDLWRETNLSEGTYSLNTWYEYDPEGFYVAVNEDGTIVGSCAVVIQSNHIAFIGLYVVKSGYRRRGIGHKMWNEALKRAGKRNVGVNPVPDQLENYRDKSGFFFQTSWSTVVCAVDKLDPYKMCNDVPSVKVKLLKSSDEYTLRNVINYDEDVIGFSRGKLVALSCDQKESFTMIAVKENNNTVCGYGSIRNNIKGNALVGPLYADDVRIAEAILYELVKAFPKAQSRGVVMMTINCNRGAMKMTEQLGFEHEPGLSRLYTEKEVIVRFEKIYGQHNLNFSVF